ncbi:hypothetical protein HanRHA438_Chr11g0485501 [Helianthus annuus]|nr:hypothetical protein HanRHA438_Chr11g0485501 [Helianthus annuus]
MVSAHLHNPNSAITESATSIFSLLDKLLGNRRSAQKINVSRTVRCGYKTSSCVTNPVRLSTDLVIFAPLATTFPLKHCSGSRPASALRSVDFPLPDGPKTARTSPGLTIPVIPVRITRSRIVLRSAFEPPPLNMCLIRRPLVLLLSVFTL